MLLFSSDPRISAWRLAIAKEKKKNTAKHNSHGENDVPASTIPITKRSTYSDAKINTSKNGRRLNTTEYITVSATYVASTIANGGDKANAASRPSTIPTGGNVNP